MQTHSQGAVRHAEKRRRGTCDFANRVARVSLAKYESTVPKSYRDIHKQTCVSAIVAHFDYQKYHGVNRELQVQPIPEVSSKDKLQVMGLGVGTKFLPASLLKEDRNNCRRIRDCHAEVLARRAFRRQILYEIESDLYGDTNSVSGYLPILEKIKNDTQRLKPDMEADESKGITPKYRLKPGVSLHFYSSSAPCGNATLKKFVKMEKETFDSSLVRSCLHRFLATSN